MREIDSAVLLTLFPCVHFADCLGDGPRAAFGYFHSCRAVRINFTACSVAHDEFRFLVVTADVLADLFLELVGARKAGFGGLLPGCRLGPLFGTLLGRAAEAGDDVLEVLLGPGKSESLVDG